MYLFIYLFNKIRKGHTAITGCKIHKKQQHSITMLQLKANKRYSIGLSF